MTMGLPNQENKDGAYGYPRIPVSSQTGRNINQTRGRPVPEFRIFRHDKGSGD